MWLARTEEGKPGDIDLGECALVRSYIILRSGFCAIVVLIGLAMLAVATAGERHARQPSVQPGIPAAEVLRTLGPGPVPARPVGPRQIDHTKNVSIDQCVQANMERLNTPGAAVAVMLDGDVIYEQGYGLTRRDGIQTVSPETIFRIGSVTKMMTAAAVMQQVELGRVDLDAPVTDYIPELEIGGRWPADLMTVWHTLTHTTGYPDLITEAHLTGNQALSTWAERQTHVKLHAPPGSFWNYSNPNFMIAGLVAERAAGIPYRQHYKWSLWEPAGMHSTTFNPDEVVATDNYAWGHYYDTVENSWVTVTPHDRDLWGAGPAGTAFSTVRDLVRWAQLLMDGGGPVVSSQSAKKMQRAHQWTHYYPDLFYGFGIMVEKYQGLDVRQHGGSVRGYGSYLLWVPERRFAVALLTNVSNPLSDAAYCVVDTVLDPDPVEEPDLSNDPSTWRKYLGNYALTDSVGKEFFAWVYLDGDRLMARFTYPGEPENSFNSRLYHSFVDTFTYDTNGDRRADKETTFCGIRDGSRVIKWMRNRHEVGERRFGLRRNAPARP
jgi:CubicO group peptidase (beta-lactamase class C family)